MRIRVSDVLDLLAAGLTTEQVVAELPDLEPADIAACLRFANIRTSRTVGEAVANPFIVLLVTKYGQVLNRDGSGYRRNAGHPHFEASFTDYDSARVFCERVVRELPHIQCEVTHGDKMVLQHFDVVWRQHEEEEIRQRFAEQDRLNQLFAKQRRRNRVGLGVLVGLVLVGVLIWYFC